MKIAADDDAADETAKITHSISQTGGDGEYSGLDDADFTIKVEDDETPSVTGASTSLAMTEPESGTASSTFTLRLDPVPTSDVTITMTVAAVTPALIAGQAWTNPDITLSASSVTLTPSDFSSGETVTVTLSTDSDAEDDVAQIKYTVTQTGGSKEYDSLNVTSTTVNITDPETGWVEFRDSASSQDDWSTDYAFDVDEGDNLTIQARLTHQPRANLFVRLTQAGSLDFAGNDNDPDVTFSTTGWSPSLTKSFPALTAQADEDSYNDVITLAARVVGAPSIRVNAQSVTVTDDDDVSAHVDTDSETMGDQNEDVEIGENASGTYQIRLNSSRLHTKARLLRCAWRSPPATQTSVSAQTRRF